MSLFMIKVGATSPQGAAEDMTTRSEEEAKL